MDRMEVVQRLRAWTPGTDAGSGEPLPLAHALRHAEVHATLVAALCLLESSGAGSERAAPARPRNAGRPWSREDDDRLLALFDAGGGVADLAGQLERTRGSIAARLVKFGRIEPPPVWISRPRMIGAAPR